MPPAIGDNLLWTPNGITQPAAPQRIAQSADAGATPSQDGATASPSTPSSASTITSNSSSSEPLDLMVATKLIQRLVDLSRWRCSYLSALLANGEINSLAVRHQTEMLIADAQSIQSLIADLPRQKK